MLTRQMRELERQAQSIEQFKNNSMNNNYYSVTYRTSDNETGVITVTGEDHVDAEANFYSIVDDNYWTVDEVLSVTTILEYGDGEWKEMEDADGWLDAYVVM